MYSRIVVGLIFFVGSVGWAQALDRVALVIGNSSYRHVPPLKNPVNDAADLTAKLRELGFKVTHVVDADQAAMDRAVNAFVGKLHKDSAAFFHFSGHGLQVQQENFLVPVDFKLTDAASVRYDAVSASKLHDRMAATGSQLNILVLDACRNGGLGLTRSSGSGLASMNAARGSFIAFATAPGRTAADNPNGRNGLFTGYLLEALSTPGLSLDEVFNEVRADTYAASEEEQLPWSSSSVIGQFFFIPGDRRDLVYDSMENAPKPAADPDPIGSRQAQPKPRPAPTASTAELDERLTLVAARAGAVKQSLDELKTSQRQDGLGLRGDMSAAERRMTYTLGQAEKLLTDGDVVGATRNLDLAERALEQLEKFLGM